MDILAVLNFKRIKFLIVLLFINSLNSQEVERQQCTYTFKVPVDEFESQCVTSEIRQTLDEIRRENKKIITENLQLKEQVENIFKEYGDIIETVKTLKADTASWRQVVEWPQLDTPFDGGDPSALIDKTTTYNDCYQALRGKSLKKQGIYTIKPKDATHAFLAYCDEDGWTVMLRRLDGKLDFYRTWSDYSGGFGEISGEQWIGLENLHLMTSSKDYQLRMEAVGYNKKMYEGEWDNFKVGPELEKYPLSIGPMTEGNHLDVMQRLNGLKFSTRDSDNDEWYQDNCALHYKSGWWLHNCGFDPNRAWCGGNGCMTWGDVHIEKILLKIRPMIAKGSNLNNVKPAKKNQIRKVKPPRVRNPPKKKVKKPKKPKPAKKPKINLLNAES